MNKRLAWLIISSIIYMICIRIDIGIFIFLPIGLLTTYLHEFSHAMMALITGGNVEYIKLSLDCSGVTGTYGGNLNLIYMGGYIGSCIFSNVLMVCSLDNNKTRNISILIAMSCIMTMILWCNNGVTATILIAIIIAFSILAKLYKIQSFVLQFIAIACLIDIIRDFNVGPETDLHEFTNSIGILSQTAWMYIWLLIVLVITFFNVRRIIKNF